MPVPAPNIPKDIKRQEIIGHREKIHDLTMAQLVIYFQNRKNFYAHAIAALPKLPNPSCPTMQIRVHKNRYLFEYHPEWYKYLAENEVCTVLEHECLHVILGHIPRFNQHLSKVADETQKRIMCMVANVAMDFSVNTLIAQYAKNALPEGILLPENHGLEKLKTFDYYLVELMNRVQIKKVKLNLISDEDGDPQDQDDGDGGEGDDSDVTINIRVKKGGKGDGGEDEQEGSGSSPGEEDGEDGESGDGAGAGGSQEGDEGQESDSPKGSGTGQGQGGEKKNSGSSPSPEITLGNQELDEHMQDANTQHDYEYDPESNLEPEDIDDSLEDQSKKMVKTAIEQISKLHGGKGRGIIPGCFEDMIDMDEEIIAPRVWERRILGRIKQTKAASEEFRINRFNYTRSTLGHNIGLFGTREDIDMFRILGMVDTSGSMGSEDIAAVLGVLQSLMRCEGDIEAKIIEFDCSIQKRYYLKKNGLVETKILGRGGTDFNPPFREAMDGVDPDGKAFKPDLIIVCTDGCAPPPNPEVRVNTNQCPVIWAIVENSYARNPCPEYGEEVRVSLN